MVVFYLLLTLSFGYCSDEQTFERKTVYVGENINLTCPRRDVGTLFWLKLVSGDFPKILGRSFSSQTADQRIRTVTDPGIFDLYITEAQQSDTGVYICMKTANRELTFLNGTYLKIEVFTSFSFFFPFLFKLPPFTTTPPSDSVHQEHTVTLQCSVFHDFLNKTCPVDDNVFCLSAEPHQSHLDSNCAHVNGRSDPQKSCNYTFSKIVSSSDEGTYYCAVATCWELFFGNGTKLQIGRTLNNMTASFLCLSESLIISFLFFLEQKAGSEFTVLTESGHDLNYAALHFSGNKSARGRKKKNELETEETVYSHIKSRV
uniref:Immunoglobulin domain-containing protein n=1 Tax=Maylandia zebra TaxID=106582 RepID=A0A3P9AR30_9CICH